MLYCFDVDGTLIRSFLRAGAPRDSFDLVEVLPGRVEKLEVLHRRAHAMALVSNQGGVALGYQTPQQVCRKMQLVLRGSGVAFTASWSLKDRVCCGPGRMVGWDALPSGKGAGLPLVYVSFGLPQAKLPEWKIDPGNSWRKPGPGMLLQAMEDYGFSAEQTVFVGDMPSDKAAADAARVHFVSAERFFK